MSSSGMRCVVKTEVITEDGGDEGGRPFISGPQASTSQSSPVAASEDEQQSLPQPTDDSRRIRRLRWKQIASSADWTNGKRPEMVEDNKFDFGDRDEKPHYSVLMPLLTEGVGKDWTVEELKTLHECINSYGINDNCIFYATKNITMRSMLEITEKIAELRELTRLRQEMRAEAQKMEWLRQVTPPSKSSEVQNWSTALYAIQKFKRKVNDHTDAALLEYLGHEVKFRPASMSTRKYFRVTDSPYARGAARREVVDCANYYRFLQTCLSGMSKFECKPLVAAVILNILDEIQREVDDPKHEQRRRILAGLFRDIQSGDLADYDFRNVVGSEDVLSVQLNPLSLMRDMLETRKEQI